MVLFECAITRNCSFPFFWKVCPIKYTKVIQNLNVIYTNRNSIRNVSITSSIFIHGFQAYGITNIIYYDLIFRNFVSKVICICFWIYQITPGFCSFCFNQIVFLCNSHIFNKFNRIFLRDIIAKINSKYTIFLWIKQIYPFIKGFILF